MQAIKATQAFYFIVNRKGTSANNTGYVYLTSIDTRNKQPWLLYIFIHPLKHDYFIFLRL